MDTIIVRSLQTLQTLQMQAKRKREREREKERGNHPTDYSSATAEELQQIPFNAEVPPNINPRGLSYELHNPFRNKTIEGIIIRVEFKDPKVTDKDVVLDVLCAITARRCRVRRGASISIARRRRGRGW